jgi:hypothetical protein
MQGQHSHETAYYRCRFPQEYALANRVDHPRNVIMREETLILPLDTWLTQAFGPLQRRHTIAKIVNQAVSCLPAARPVPATPTAAGCDAKLARYRAALDAGPDPAVVAGWIAETQAERLHAQQQTQPPRPAPDEIGHLTEEQVIAIVDELGDMITALREAEPEHKLEVYRNLGLRLTYHPETQTVHAEINLAAHRWDSVRVRGATRTNTPWPTVLDCHVYLL